MTYHAEHSWTMILADLVARKDLTPQQIDWAMNEIMTGQTSEAIIGAFLVALHVKGETPDELNALAQGMLDKAEPIEVTQNAVDIVGTGGDLQNTVNISTMASLVIAGAGIPVIKHGNRSSTSSSGSADVLEVLGVNLALPIHQVAEAVNKTGITFLFAQVFHPSMKFVAPVRRSLGVPTAFNYLGPMTNPARVRASAIGVADAKMAEKIAQVFASRGDHALVFRGSDGLDEITITGESQVWETGDGSYVEHIIRPTDFGFEEGSLDDLRGGDAKHNAQVVIDTLSGKQGAIRTAVVLNVASAIVAFEPQGSSTDFKDRFAQAIARAEESIDSGAAHRVLDQWVAYTNQ
ncbi:anthranilate phosphoribosyltransferase [Rothia sp. ZJ932]|nr:anthranilate phosphoribosyltransferase [Rothia sp. ZJ932]QRZ62591.1 anthranilate phosphoribosyltransferase [Rothia sp. ZJ932]